MNARSFLNTGAFALSAADLLVGVANIPGRITSQLWVREDGIPDSMWFSVSNGRDFTLRHDVETGTWRLFEREHEVHWKVLEQCTGLKRAEVDALADEVYARLCEQQREVER